VERSKPPYAIVYHRCRECRRSAVETEAGRVEVSPEAVDRIELFAEAVELEDEALARDAKAPDESVVHFVPGPGVSTGSDEAARMHSL